MPHRRSAFFVSDRTGITAESLGHTLLTQFEATEFKRETIPFIDTPDKADEVNRRIAERAQNDHHRPLGHEHSGGKFIRLYARWL